jgi:hypothetical protein
MVLHSALRAFTLARRTTLSGTRPLLRRSQSGGGDYTLLDARNKGVVNMPVSVVIGLATVVTSVVTALVTVLYISSEQKENIISNTKMNKIEAELRELQLKGLRAADGLDDIEEQRKVIYSHMSDMTKPSLQFDLKPKNTKAINTTFREDLASALRVASVPVRILCVPPGYGKSYALCSLFKELKKTGIIAGADIVRGDQSFVQDDVDLDDWLLQRLGVKEKHSKDLEAYFMKPVDCEGDMLPYYIVFDQLDKVRFHQFFEDFILRLKDIGLRHKNVRFVVSTHEPLVAEQIHAMNDNEKIRFSEWCSQVARPSPLFCLSFISFSPA